MASDFELQVLAELSAIKSVGAATSAQVESLQERLFNGGSGVITTLQSDIQEIKDDRQQESRWEKIHNIAHYAMTPLIVGAHAVARHFGIEI